MTPSAVLGLLDDAPLVVELVAVAVGIVVVSIPLAASMWAFLDCARRPAWVWAMARRGQVIWLCILGFGTITIVGGLLTAGWYLARVRPELARVEDGDIGA